MALYQDGFKDFDAAPDAVAEYDEQTVELLAVKLEVQPILHDGMVVLHIKRGDYYVALFSTPDEAREIRDSLSRIIDD